MSHDEAQETTQQESNSNPTVPAPRSFTPNKEQRQELKALSQEVFGVSSKWQKLLEYDEVKKTKVKETVPGENGAPDTEREVEVPLYVPGTKVKQSTRRYRSIEEVLELLREFKAKRDEYIAQIKKQQEEAKAKKEAEEQARKVQEQLGGSALT